MPFKTPPKALNSESQITGEGNPDCQQNLRIDEICVEGDLAKSKIAWKVKKLMQSLVYRLCELSDSCYLTWANNHHISSLILARSIIETSVIFRDLDEQIGNYLSNEDLDSIDKLIMQRTFSTRIEGMMGKVGEYKATNILTLVQKQDKIISGLLSTYENLSEVAHPNHFGVSQAYGDLNRESGTVVFGEVRFVKAKFSAISCAFCMIALSCEAFERLEESVKKIAELQHRINPVKK